MSRHPYGLVLRQTVTGLSALFGAKQPALLRTPVRFAPRFKVKKAPCRV